MKQSPLLLNVLQSVLVAATLAILGGTIKVYLDVHDLKLVVTELKGKQDWLFQYEFPKEKE